MGFRIDLAAFAKELEALPPDARAAAVADAVGALPDRQRDTVTAALGIHLPDPDQATANRLWLIIVSAFCLVMVGAMTVLAISVFAPGGAGAVMPETILTVFTMAASFLAGLLAPSPLARRE